MIEKNFIEMAFRLGRESMADAILICANVSAESLQLISAAAQQSAQIPVLLACRSRDCVDVSKTPGIVQIPIPDHPMTRLGQAKIALLVGLARGHLDGGDVVVLLTGVDRSRTLDTVVVVNLKSESELISVSQSIKVPAEIDSGVFEKVLGIASQLATEGREGRPLGAIFVVGDSEKVLTHSRNLVLNPFFGYKAEQRNIMDETLEETIKEYASIDGAFIISGSGLVESAGAQLTVQKPSHALKKGFGTRHSAAAAITENTNAISICLSQSTGSLSVFRAGRLVVEISKPNPDIVYSL